MRKLLIHLSIILLFLCSIVEIKAIDYYAYFLLANYDNTNPMKRFSNRGSDSIFDIWNIQNNGGTELECKNYDIYIYIYYDL